jgi:hypothetical protein
MLSSTGFKAPQSEIEFLRRRLKEEQETSEKENRARLEADARCDLAEKERDIYKLLALRWKGRRRQGANQQLAEEDGMEHVEEAATAMLLGGRGSLSLVGLRNVFRRFQDHASDSDESDDYDDVGDELFDESNTDRMEEDDNMIEDDGDEESSVSMNSDSGLGRASLISESGETYQSSNALVIRRQVRTVSITGEDI